MRKTLSCITVFTAVMLCLAYICTAIPANGEEIFPSIAPDTYSIIRESFEEGFGQWSPLGGGAELKIDDRFSKGGSKSLCVSNREHTWSGPCISTSRIFQSGEKYTFEAFVHHDGTEMARINWVLQYDTTLNEVLYLEIASAEVAPGNWDFLKAEIEMPENMTSSSIYFEAPDQDLVFNIDEVSISGKKIAGTTTSKDSAEEFTFGFEQDAESWKSRGNAKTERVSNFSYLGRYSLYTSERDKYWNGPVADIDSIIRTGVCYEFSAYVMYNGRIYENEHDFQIELQYILNGKEEHTPVDSKTVQKGNWSKLCGEYSVPEGATAIQLFIQTADVNEDQTADENDLMPFYIDNVKISDITLKNQRKEQAAAVHISILIAVLLIAGILSVLIYRMIGSKNSELSAASLDAMTNTLNRNSFEIKVAHFQNAPDECRKIWITVCDVNFLKTINDNYGHQKGDDAIIRCASLLNRVIGKRGSVYRTGGDEFICITRYNPELKLRTEFQIESQQYNGYPFSVAVGSARYEPEEDGPVADIKAILTRSDKEMYKDKEQQKKNMNNMM